jgi:N-methylhydantoinase A
LFRSAPTWRASRSSGGEQIGEIRERSIEIVNCRVQAVGLVPRSAAPTARKPGSLADARIGMRPVYFGENRGWIDTSIYRRDTLPSTTALHGPVVIEEMSSTTLVPPDRIASVDQAGNIVIAH